MGRGITGNVTAQDRLRRRDRDKGRRLMDATRSVFKTDDGRLVLRWMLGPEVCNLLGPSYGLGSEDSGVVAWREGRRSIGLEVLRLTEEAEPGSFALLMAEDSAEKSEDRTHKRDAETAPAED